MLQLNDKSSFFHRHFLSDKWSPDSCKINLSITLDNNKILSQSNLQAREVIKLIEGQKDDNSRFNLTFVNENEVSRFLKKEILPQSYLNIEFTGLDG